MNFRITIMISCFQFEGQNNTILRARSGENVTLDCVVFLRQDTTVKKLKWQYCKIMKLIMARIMQNIMVQCRAIMTAAGFLASTSKTLCSTFISSRASDGKKSYHAATPVENFGLWGEKSYDGLSFHASLCSDRRWAPFSFGKVGQAMHFQSACSSSSLLYIAIIIMIIMDKAACLFIIIIFYYICL